MSSKPPPDRVEKSAAELEQDPEVLEVLEGRDAIKLSPELVDDEAASVSEEPVRRESMYTRIRAMPVAARVKLAMSGNKEARQLLSRDPVKLVQTCVLRNPRITLEEALAMAKNRSLNGDLLRTIAGEKEWVRHYGVRLALVQNPKTPLQVALSLLGGVRERDMRTLARSKNVPSVLQQQARRTLMRREGK